MNDNKYFSAQEAREILDGVKSQKMKNELDWIYEMINKAILDGKNEIILSNKTLMKATDEFLKAKGFKISHYYTMDHSGIHPMTQQFLGET